MRRVVVKTRYVQQAGKNGKAAAHLRYIQRDGTSRDGERGQLYSATEDRADGDAFVERGKDDRHQFRFIVSPEDAVDLSDLTEHTRDLMKQIEGDLGTKLDWVAVNHYNTGHPHVHVIVRGKDDLGCPPSAPLRQIRDFREGRISGSSQPFRSADETEIGAGESSGRA
ncbi:relaxase/mobilization nuclease domain-containing protein, partial [Bosea spartocytisi]